MKVLASALLIAFASAASATPGDFQTDYGTGNFGSRSSAGGSSSASDKTPGEFMNDYASGKFGQGRTGAGGSGSPEHERCAIQRSAGVICP